MELVSRLIKLERFGFNKSEFKKYIKSILISDIEFLQTDVEGKDIKISNLQEEINLSKSLTKPLPKRYFKLFLFILTLFMKMHLKHLGYFISKRPTISQRR
jgi:hypothetical protein